MKKQLLVIAILTWGLHINAQNNTKMQNGYHLTIVQNDNGKEQVTDRTFATKEELDAYMRENNMEAPEPPAPPEPPAAPAAVTPPSPPAPPAAPRVLLPVSARLYGSCGKPVEKKTEKTVIIKKEHDEVTETVVEETSTRSVVVKEPATVNLTGVKLYPNPSKGDFTVQFNVDKPADVKLRITNIEGKEVYSETLKNFSGRFDKKITRDNMPLGTYILDVETEGQKESIRIAVQ